MWPVLKHYNQQHLQRIALPLGGIGTGTVSLGGRGDLRDWEIMNRPAKRFTPADDEGGTQFPCFPFFAIHAGGADGAAFTRVLEGPLELSDYEGAFGSVAANHGLPRFRSCSFSAAYPFGQVELSDPEMPLQVRLEAFNPLIPGDAERSGIPVAVLRYVLHNPTEAAITATVCGNMPNFIGIDGSQSTTGWDGRRIAVGAKGNCNSFRSGDGVQGIFMQAGELPPTAETWGTMALTTTAERDISYRTNWASFFWGGSVLDFWDDFTADGMLDERAGVCDTPMASLAVRVEIPAGESRAVTFLLSWHFPNRYSWTPRETNTGCGCGGQCPDEDDRIGNYYTGQYNDAWQVAERTAAQLAQLEADTLQFVTAFCASALPDAVKEAALFNLSTLRSQTSFRTPDGRFFGFEGCCDRSGCCTGSCTHVWNYEQALAFLFGELVADHARGGIRPCHRREWADVFPRQPAVEPRQRAWQSGGGWANGLPDEAVSRLAVERRRCHAARAVAEGEEGAGILLDPRRLGCRPRRRDGRLPAQHHGCGILRAERADGRLVPGRPPRHGGDGPLSGR